MGLGHLWDFILRVLLVWDILWDFILGVLLVTETGTGLSKVPFLSHYI